MLAKLAYWVGVAVFFAVIYTLVLWVTTSFILTASGPVRWEEGWIETKKQILMIDKEDCNAQRISHSCREQASS